MAKKKDPNSICKIKLFHSYRQKDGGKMFFLTFNKRVICGVVIIQ